MAFYSQLFDKSSDFRSESEIKNLVKKSKNYKNEDVANSKILNFFNTSKQRSYLVTTDEMVYCIVDDSRKNEAKINWSMGKELFASQSITLKDKTVRTGLVNFGEKHKNWLYTKSIFNNEDNMKNSISKLLS